MSQNQAFTLPQVFAAALLAAVSMLCCPDVVYGQAGLRESLERLDRNEDGEIQPDEITPLSRPYLERVARAQRMSMDRTYEIERWQDAARSYFAIKNGVYGRDVRPSGESSVKEFGTLPGEPLVPDFGLAEVKYPYTQDDLDFADRTMRSHDRNRDGYIDRREAEREEWTHRNPFDDDLNKDERLSRMELAQRYARRRLLDGAADELRQKSRRVGGEAWRSSRNDDDDRRRDDSPWYRRGNRYYLAPTLLGRFDANRNGRLEPQEAANLGIPTGRIDADRDGELTRDELQAYLSELQDEVGDLADGLPGWFFERDENRDQQVAMSEFADEWDDQKLEEFASLDTNSDGLLTASEVMRSKAMVGGTYNNTNAEIIAPRKTIISEIVVTEDYPIGDLNLQLSITHTHTSYLDAYLTGPDGERVELFTSVGGSDDHFEDTVFDDQSRYPITKARPPFKGTFMPEAVLKRQPGLSQFNGKSVKGVWQLIIRGTRNERFGMLHRWGLIVKPLEEMMGADAPEPVNDGPQESEIPTTSTFRTPTPSQVVRTETPRKSDSGDYRSRASAEAKRVYYESLKKRGFDESPKPGAEMSEERRKAMAIAREKAAERYRKYLEKMKGDGGDKEKRKD